MTAIAPEVLGQILVLQSGLHAVVDPRRLAEVLCQGLSRIPGVQASSAHLDGEIVARSAAPPVAELSHDTLELPLATVFREHGRVCLWLDEPTAFAPYRPFVDNSVSVAALVLSALAQQRRLEASQRELETRVDERTAELAAANHALAERERFIKSVIDAAPNLIYIFDLDSASNRFANRSLTRFLGYDEVGLLGVDVETKVFHPDDLESIRAHHGRMRDVADGQTHEIEYRMRHADGSWRVLSTCDAVFTRGEDGRATEIVGVATDRTEQRESEGRRAQLEEQLRLTQRLESIGQLAAGIAHDFNNLLAPILGLATVMMEEAGHDHPDLASLADIRDAALRGRLLTRQLLAIGARQPLELRTVDLADVVRDCSRMLRRAVREDIELDVVLPVERHLVVADPGQIGQVLLNLVINAQDALPDGGSIAIALRGGQMEGVEPPVESAVGAPPGVLLTVTDTGVGMDAATLGQAREPFFTTKGREKGTGLGLSTVHGIVTQHGGRTHIESHLGRGTTVTLWFPAARGDADTELAVAVATPAPEPGGHRVVLVVEDDEHVRRLACRMLAKLGHTALAAGGGEAALALAVEHAGPIDLVLSDVIMPGLSGADFVAALHRLRPGLPVLYMSGYPDDILASRRASDSAPLLLRKPFELPELDQAIRAALCHRLR